MANFGRTKNILQEKLAKDDIRLLLDMLEGNPLHPSETRLQLLIGKLKRMEK